MAFARDPYTATASQTDFTITFPYLSEDDVTVTKDGVLQTVGASNDYTIVSSTTVRFNSGLTAGEVVILQRSTSQTTRLVDYTAGPLAEADLDNDSLQAFYMAQEAVDIANTAMVLNGSNQWDGQSKKIQDVATPTASTDAATKGYVDGLVIAAGNVPTPNDPGEDGYTLVAKDGTFSWALGPVSDDAGTGAGPRFDLYRNSPSPADNDTLAELTFSGENDADEKVTYARMYASTSDVSDGTEDGSLTIETIRDGSLSLRGYFQSGLVMGAPTGGDQGQGTVNATGLYVNGVAVGVGAKTKWIDAQDLTPQTTNGAASVLTESTTNDVMNYGLAFDQTTQEYAQWRGQLEDWDNGTITATFYWTAPSGVVQCRGKLRACRWTTTTQSIQHGGRLSQPRSTR